MQLDSSAGLMCLILCIKRCESVPHAPRHHPGFDPLHFVKSSWPTFDQYLTHIWPVFNQYFIKILPIYVVLYAPMFNFDTLNLTYIWPLFDQHLTHIWPAFDPYLFLMSSLLHLDLNLLNLFDPLHFLLKLFSFHFFPSVWFWLCLIFPSAWFCKELGWSALYVLVCGYPANPGSEASKHHLASRTLMSPSQNLHSEICFEDDSTKKEKIGPIWGRMCKSAFCLQLHPLLTIWPDFPPKRLHIAKLANWYISTKNSFFFF